MKQLKIINAYEVLESLSENDKLSYEALWDLFQLKKCLQPHFDFFQERVDALRAKYTPLADEHGQLTGQAMQDYAKEMNELGNMDKEVDFTTLHMSLKDVPGLTLRTLEDLEPFIEFTKE